MVLFWFLLALVLLVAALVLLRLDSAQKRRRTGARPEELGAATGPDRSGLRDDLAPGPVATAATTPDEPEPEPVTTGSDPRPAPFQRLAEGEAVSPEAAALSAGPAHTSGGARPLDDRQSRVPDASDDRPDGDALAPGTPAPSAEQAGETEAAGRTGSTAVAVAGAAAGAVGGAGLVGRVRSMIAGRGRAALDDAGATGADASRSAAVTGDDAPEAPAAHEGEDLDDSPVVDWLETRGFRPTADPAPLLRHGDFAAGLPPLGAVSTGVFRGRAALMAVSGGHTVLGLRRPAASDVVVDLAREDVAADPALRHSGVIGRLGVGTDADADGEVLPSPVDHERVTAAVSGLPAEVRRLWVEADWAVATVDGRDALDAWDETVVALDSLADTFAVLPPAGGVGAPLPAGTDPVAPGAADGPEVDPATGMDGSTPTAHGAPGSAVSEPAPSAADAEPMEDASTAEDDTPATARTIAMAPVRDVSPTGSSESETPGTDTTETSGTGDRTGDASEEDRSGRGGGRAGLGAAVAGAAAAGLGALRGRRHGHLRVVPEESESMRSLSDRPVVPDQGGTREDGEAGERTTAVESTGTHPETPTDDTTADDTTADVPADAPTGTHPEAGPEEEPSPFDAVMTSGGVPADRGDVAADHLPPRPPLPRPSRGAGQTFGTSDPVPPLGSTDADAGIKPLGTAGDEDSEEIRSDLAAFEASRLDGGPDAETPEADDDRPAGRHGDGAGLTVQELLARAELSPRTGGRRHRRADDDERLGDADGPSGRSGGATNPDLEETTSFEVPPDLRERREGE